MSNKFTTISAIINILSLKNLTTINTKSIWFNILMFLHTMTCQVEQYISKNIKPKNYDSCFLSLVKVGNCLEIYYILFFGFTFYHRIYFNIFTFYNLAFEQYYSYSKCNIVQETRNMLSALNKNVT